MNTEKSDDGWITFLEGCRRMQVGRKALDQIVRDGRLTVMTTPTQRRYLKAGEVAEFINASITPAKKGGAA